MFNYIFYYLSIHFCNYTRFVSLFYIYVTCPEWRQCNLEQVRSTSCLELCDCYGTAVLSFVTHTSRPQCAARRAAPCSPACMFTTTRCSPTTTIVPAPSGRQPTRRGPSPHICPMLATGRVSTYHTQFRPVLQLRFAVRRVISTVVSCS